VGYDPWPARSCDLGCRSCPECTKAREESLSLPFFQPFYSKSLYVLAVCWSGSGGRPRSQLLVDQVSYLTRCAVPSTQVRNLRFTRNVADVQIDQAPLGGLYPEGREQITCLTLSITRREPMIFSCTASWVPRPSAAVLSKGSFSSVQSAPGPQKAPAGALLRLIVKK
jgi:hypothetical protein